MIVPPLFLCMWMTLLLLVTITRKLTLLNNI
jgi:hypothetical protein